MGSNKLSAVLEKQIRHLCLTDFPCGYGSWRKTKDRTNAAETEEIGDLLGLLSCPHSPWWYDVSWSPQAPALRKLAVLSPECLQTDFIYNYFTTLRIMDKGVSDIDDGLLKFSKLEELVLSANKISEIPAENLPSTLKILDLRANWLSALNSLTNCSLPRIQYLSLGSNSLSHHDNISHLTGTHWPQLLCLDLGDCEFQDQHALLCALITLPCLKTLVLEGNPFTLAPSYPGFTVDSLPQLSCLDNSWISPEERCRFRGLAKMSDLTVDQASATVTVGRMKGIPNPLMNVEENASDFPVVTYSYFVTYEFLSHVTPVDLVTYPSNTVHSLISLNQTVIVSLNLTQPMYQRMVPVMKYYNQTRGLKEKPPNQTVEVAMLLHMVITIIDVYSSAVSRHNTLKMTWSECMDFNDTQTHIISDLGTLKKFLNQGLYLRIEEEKVLSWPVASEDVPGAKPSETVKEKKGGKVKSPIKSASTKDKSKDKKKKSVPELVQDAPIRRRLGSVHIPLQSLVKGDHKVDVLCDLGVLCTKSEVEALLSPKKDLGNKTEDKESKQREYQKNITSSKGKGKGKKERGVDVHKNNTVSTQQEAVTVEVRVELEKWQSASEAHQLLLSHQTF